MCDEIKSSKEELQARIKEQGEKVRRLKEQKAEADKVSEDIAFIPWRGLLILVSGLHGFGGDQRRWLLLY